MEFDVKYSLIEHEGKMIDSWEWAAIMEKRKEQEEKENKTKSRIKAAIARTFMLVAIGLLLEITSISLYVDLYFSKKVTLFIYPRSFFWLDISIRILYFGVVYLIVCSVQDVQQLRRQLKVDQLFKTQTNKDGIN